MPRGKKRGKLPVDTDGRFCYTDNMIKMRCGASRRREAGP